METFLLILLVVLMVAGIIFMEIRFAKTNNTEADEFYTIEETIAYLKGLGASVAEHKDK